MRAPEVPTLGDSRLKEAVGNDSGLTVILCDPLESRLQSITRVVAGCGAKSLRIAEPSNAATAESTFGAGLAVIALGELPKAAAESLRIVSALKKMGIRVICHEAGAHLWPLGVQCQPLLAGAWKLLDSGSPNFSDELRQLINRHFEEESERAGEEARVRSEMRRLGIVGESRSLISAFRWAIRVSALSDLPTLITGETGTGKELLARAIHQLDPKRGKGPFVALNCGAINPGLIESELFGHRRGAFTGADRERKGLIRSAQSGVLFLDEIGELDPNAQTKLLRVLQENYILAVGEDRETAVDVRVIAATNRDLDEKQRNGTFRRDLYHRLNVLSVHIPSLRDRPDDLQPLIEHFIARFRSIKPGRPMSVRPGFVQALARVELPGNARQLENLVRRALVDKNDHSPLDLSDLPPEIWKQISEETRSSAGAGAQVEQAADQEHGEITSDSEAGLRVGELVDVRGWNLPRSLDYCEKILLETALRRAKGSQSQTARLLGITPRSVYNKLRKHGLHQH
jgi:DNA-binding NtrC family response regulator